MNNKDMNIEICKNTLEKYLVSLKSKNQLTECDKEFYEKFCEYYELNFSVFLQYIIM